MKALEVLFWISLFIVFYTYIGYGIPVSYTHLTLPTKA